ncbi:MAG: TolC family protein [Pirellulales bacterium]|nr:TolC family protein [Pirellulales bacterium]
MPRPPLPIQCWHKLRRQPRLRAYGRALSGWIVCAVLLLGGCGPAREYYFFEGHELDHYRDVATSIDYPDVSNAQAPDEISGMAPRTLATHGPTEYWDLTLEEAVRMALVNSKVMHDLGGRVITAPQLVATYFDPAIQESDPQLGVEAALSRFDAQLATQVFWEKNDRVINNAIIGGGVRELQQDIGQFRSELSKRAATGTLFAVRHNVDYDANNRPFNLFPSAWDVNFEVAVQHPLLRGGGIDFNRIAGPDAQPGFVFRNGVLLARVDNDISLAQFEAGVRDLVSNVENAYWDLYFAYRLLDARVKARDSALATWRRVEELYRSGAAGGSASDEAQAGARYFVLWSAVQDALSGRAAGSTQPLPGARSGAFTGAGGLYARESNLRFLMGVSLNDGRLIRPANEPTIARVAYDWNEVAGEALVRRVELRQQKWRIKRRELELVASRNFLLPQLDLLGQYRWRGFGDQLINQGDSIDRFDNAWQNLTSGDFQEWQTGIQLSMPLGFREGYTAVRNAQLALARERAVLADQERLVVHDLGAALRELDRAYAVSQANFNARLKAVQRASAVREQYEAGIGNITLDVLLDAESDQSEAEISYFRSLVEYNLAIKAMHFESGALLDYCQVHLAEGGWPMKAYQDARDEARRRSAAWRLNYGYDVPGPVTPGAAQQHAPSPAKPADKGVERLPAPAPGQLPEPLPTAAPRQPVVEPVFENPLDDPRHQPLQGPLVGGGSAVPSPRPAAGIVQAVPDAPLAPRRAPLRDQAVQPAAFLAPNAGKHQSLPGPHSATHTTSP